MRSHLDPPLVPRDGKVLRVVGIARISTVHQNEKSLHDQEALLRRYVESVYSGPINWTFLSSQVSGQYLDTDTLAELEKRIESGSVDLVGCEDLGRICRRHKAYSICETAQDCGTRLIALNDNVDTAREDWQMGALFGVYRHEAYIRDTSKRIRRSLSNRFQQGGVVQFVLYGYVQRPTPGSPRTPRPGPSTTAGLRCSKREAASRRSPTGSLKPA